MEDGITEEQALTKQLDLMNQTYSKILISKHKKLKSLQYFIERLATEGGSIVSSDDCSGIEIATAQACDRFLTIGCIGYVYRPSTLTADSNTGVTK